MAKRKRDTTDKTIEKRISEGRGSGTLKDYKPWLLIHDVASLGLVSRVLGIKTQRIHHLLSRNETLLFMIFDLMSQIVDIREQFPLLPLSETLKIAEILGVPHPRDPKTKHPIVLTTDFLLSIKVKRVENLFPRTFKTLSDFNDPRVREKLEIERRYWAVRTTRGNDWGVITEREIDPILANNCVLIHDRHSVKGLPANSEEILAIWEKLTPLIKDEQLPLNVASRKVDNLLSFSPGTSLTIAYHFIATKRWVVNLRIPIEPSKVLSLVNKEKL